MDPNSAGRDERTRFTLDINQLSGVLLCLPALRVWDSLAAIDSFASQRSSVINHQTQRCYRPPLKAKQSDHVSVCRSSPLDGCINQLMSLHVLRKWSLLVDLQLHVERKSNSKWQPQLSNLCKLQLNNAFTNVELKFGEVIPNTYLRANWLQKKKKGKILPSTMGINAVCYQNFS